MRTLTIVLSLYFALAYEAIAQPSQSSNITVVVRDFSGMPLEGARISLGNGTLEKASTVDGKATFNSIRFGRYNLEVRMPGFATRVERIRVYQSALTLRIGLEVAANHASETLVILGRIVGQKDSSDIWVRLVGVYNGDLIEDTVDGQGKFELAGVDMEPYILLVFEKDRLVPTKPVQVKSVIQELTVNLESTPGK